jgi:hypothetical protein
LKGAHEERANPAPASLHDVRAWSAEVIWCLPLAP